MTEIILIASVACLLVAMFKLLQRPAKRHAPGVLSIMSIEIECDAAPALAQLREVSEALERIAQQQERIGVPAIRLEVKEPARTQREPRGPRTPAPAKPQGQQKRRER